MLDLVPSELLPTKYVLYIVKLITNMDGPLIYNQIKLIFFLKCVL